MYKIYYGRVAVLFTLLTSLSSATVYQWEDAQGQQHFSDKKQPHASIYQLAKNDSYYPVKTIYDGDTIQLLDGRKIRFLGINTPEIEHPNQPEQAGGMAAKQWLTQQLKGKKVRLEFDVEKQDKYHRYLAHLFTKQGLHLNKELVRLGLANLNIYPPNLKFVSELQAAEQEAERNKRGIWKLSAYQVKTVKQLNKRNKQGWQRIVGRIESIKKTRKNIYLKLNNHFDVRIRKKYLPYFPKLSDLKGQRVEVRGWVNQNKNIFSMQIKHSSAIKVIE